MGPHVSELFVRALKRGPTTKITRVKIVIVGKDRTGKTSFKRSLLNQKFQDSELSTPVVARPEVAVCEACNWRVLHDKDEELLDRQIARAAIHAQGTANVDESGSEDANQTNDENREIIHSQLGTNTSSEATAPIQDTASATNTDELDNKAAAAIDDAESSTGDDKLDEAIVLTESIGRAIEQFKNDPDLLKQEASKVYYAIWDLGGQEILLPGQQQAITPGSIVCVVFDARKYLDDIAQSFHCSSTTSEGTHIPNVWIETNYDAVSLWASGTFLARIEDWYILEQYASPVMFLIGTHIAAASEKLIKDQNAFLSKKFCDQKFTEHIYRPSDDPDDWFFHVENSVSDPESPTEDPGVIAVKHAIEKVTGDESFKCVIPATWSVLEKICDALEKKLGSALSYVKVIMPFAERLCHIFDEAEVRLALVYLDKAGSVIFPQAYLNTARSLEFRQKSEKLKDVVVTKPNWLFKVYSVIASVHYPSGLFSTPWKEAKKSGIVSWKLMKYFLKKAGVKEDEYEVALNLLNWFYMLCPKPSPSAPVIPYETDYLVPCLLESESKKQPKDAARVNPNDCKPFSLIVSPCNVAFIPEQLHFRLMMCCIENYPKEPTLTRYKSVYRVETGVTLEIIYHSKKYLIVTINTNRPCHLIADLCIKIRRFIIEKLRDLKELGLPNFEFSLNIQRSEPVDAVDPTKLVCIDKYNEDMQLRENESKRDVELDHNEKAALDCWFYEQKNDAQGTAQQLEGQADKTCTHDEIVDVALKVSAHWEHLVLVLSPSTFNMNKIEEIQKDQNTKLMQAIKALELWTSTHSGAASRRLLIKSMCKIHWRLQAEDVFGRELVQCVSPQKND